VSFETIAEVADPSAARVLILALKAHGFHPIEGGDSGLPGLPGVFGPKGVPIQVLEEEADDARVLAEELLRQMRETPAKEGT
jgi:hypothetical protein